MSSAYQRGGLAIAALAAAAVLAGCASNREAEAEAEAARVAAEIAARTPPPIALNQSVAEAASIYVAFTRDMAAIEGGFNDPEAIQAALRKGSAYDPAQLSRGLIAYASILALQSPEFVAGVRQYAVHPETRQKLISDIVADPRHASYLPGADAAAGLIMSTLREDINALGRAANSVESDAYAIQASHDPRRFWGMAQVFDREGRLEAAKTASGQPMLPSGDEAARLLAAAHDGSGLGLSGDPRRPPYPPAVQNAIALAALAALGAAGDNARANTDALQNEPRTKACLDLSKLMLFQCLAASRPSYEDMFCVGRHIVRDLATCTRGAALPAGISTVSDLTPVETPRPRIVVQSPPPQIVTAPPPPATAPAAARPPVVVATPARPPAATQPPAPSQAPARSLTERLNTTPASGDNE